MNFLTQALIDGNDLNQRETTQKNRALMVRCLIPNPLGGNNV